MLFPPFSHHLGQDREFGFIQLSPGTVDPTGNKEESVRQNQSPQAGHGSDYNAASPPRKVPQSFTNRNSALPALRYLLGTKRTNNPRRPQ